jgi:hypothetical protein
MSPPASAKSFGKFIYAQRSSQPMGKGRYTLIKFTERRRVITIK